METLDKVIDTINSLNHHQTELESVFQSTQLGHIDDVMEAVSFCFYLQMYMTLTEEEHVNQYHLLGTAKQRFAMQNMNLVTFVVGRDMHALVVSFTVLEKDYRKPPLAMFEIETVPVLIPDMNTRANSYTKVSIHRPYITTGDDYYIQLCKTESVICKLIHYTYYFEELFVVKHKNKHSCANAIFYD